MCNENTRILELIIYIKNKMPYSSEGELLIYDELLQLSIQDENLYGQALAYIRFSRAYQNMQNHVEYEKCIEQAYQIAESEQFPDILIRYYNLEGVRYMQNFEEANSLSMYLKGICIAMESGEYTLCALFYNNIAEIFYGNYDYDKAIFYYLKALNILNLENRNDSSRYCKAFMENLINSYCLKKDLKNAKKYLLKCQSLNCDDTIRPFALEEAQIRVLMLEGKKEEALQDTTSLFYEVTASEFEDTLLFYAYSFLCDIFLEFQKKEETSYCLSRLLQMKWELNQNFIMETQKRRVRFCQVFCTPKASVLKEFYHTSLQCESNNTNAISNSLSASVSLYETKKQKRLMKKERNDLEKIIMYDPLTGAYNRRSYNQIVNDSLYKSDVHNIAYIMIDIDHFKEYNDCYGHHKGDKILKLVSTLIQEILPAQAYLARYGGDEFSCLLLNKSKQEVDCFMKNIQTRIKEAGIEHKQAGNRKQLTLSLGAYYTEANEYITLDLLTQKADDALYQVKNRGRNGFCIL